MQLENCEIELKQAQDLKYKAARVMKYVQSTKTHILRMSDDSNVEVDLNFALNEWRYINLLGKKIEMKWPLDDKFYSARVADYRASTRKHLLCYVSEQGVSTEQVNLNDTHRVWHVSMDQCEKHDLIGKRIVFDPYVPEADLHTNTACVLDLKYPLTPLPCRGACCKRQFSTFSNAFFTIIYVSDDFLTTVRLADYNFVLENEFEVYN